jgi:restriction endonuclease S subunit
MQDWDVVDGLTNFKQLDNTITLHQRKLDLLKEQKKAFYKICLYRVYNSQITPWKDR